ncbi:hypothetical protein SAY87_019804 [Trapa incisa]|uniref:AB hydrolase-1 domain-containing protein n=1 Tax=Trapa incisa TaxID=236973 RepID=A0AAN7JZT8_9MYRT|nr:hypothetical protein SAY87_019804 [Trapa incisa]
MVNLIRAYEPILRVIMRLAGLRPQKVEIKPGTVVNVWSPTRPSGKPAVVLLHGFSADGILTWQFQALSLAGKYSVYVVDFIFFGGSATDNPDRSVAFQARCVARALGMLGVDQCTLVGVSYGGMVGFELARVEPELVRSLVVTCSVMTMTESISTDRLGKVARSAGVAFTRWSDYLLPETSKGVRTLFQIGTYKLYRRIPDWVFRQYLEAMFDYRNEKTELLEALVIPDDEDPNKIPNFLQPVRLLWGGNDKIFPLEMAQALKEKLGDTATLEHIDGAGHLVMLERPFAYNHRLRRILDSIHP